MALVTPQPGSDRIAYPIADGTELYRAANIAPWPERRSRTLTRPLWANGSGITTAPAPSLPGDIHDRQTAPDAIGVVRPARRCAGWWLPVIRVSDRSKLSALATQSSVTAYACRAGISTTRSHSRTSRRPCQTSTHVTQSSASGAVASTTADSCCGGERHEDPAERPHGAADCDRGLVVLERIEVLASAASLARGSRPDAVLAVRPAGRWRRGQERMGSRSGCLSRTRYLGPGRCYRTGRGRPRLEGRRQ